MTITIPAWLLWTLLALVPWVVLVPWAAHEDRQCGGYFSGLYTVVAVLVAGAWTAAVVLGQVVAWRTR